MKTHLFFIIFFPLLLLLNACENTQATYTPEQQPGWEDILREQIGLLGHRNWVVVADAAYPLQSNAAIRTVLSDEDHLTTVRKAYEILSTQPHVSPVVYLDLESEYLTDEQVPGISDYRGELGEILPVSQARMELHEDIIRKLDEAAELFNVLIIKTDFTLPYTTVFFQLDCAYWGPDDEAALRELMKQE